MKVLLLGATGRTWREILDVLLGDQYSVRILVRDTAKVKCESDKLDVMVGDLTKAVTGCRAIISALNISRTSDFPWSSLRTPVVLFPTR